MGKQCYFCLGLNYSTTMLTKPIKFQAKFPILYFFENLRKIISLWNQLTKPSWLLLINI